MNWAAFPSCCLVAARAWAGRFGHDWLRDCSPGDPKAASAPGGPRSTWHRRGLDGPAGGLVRDDAALAATTDLPAGQRDHVLPVLMPLAPAATLTTRLPECVSGVLEAHGVPTWFVERELAAMAEGRLASSTSRRLTGSMTEFARLAGVARANDPAQLDRVVALAVDSAVWPPVRPARQPGPRTFSTRGSQCTDGLIRTSPGCRSRQRTRGMRARPHRERTGGHEERSRPTTSDRVRLTHGRRQYSKPGAHVPLSKFIDDRRRPLLATRRDEALVFPSFSRRAPHGPYNSSLKQHPNFLESQHCRHH